MGRVAGRGTGPMGILCWLRIEKSRLPVVRNSLISAHSPVALPCVLGTRWEEEMQLSELLTEPEGMGHFICVPGPCDAAHGIAMAVHGCVKLIWKAARVEMDDSCSFTPLKCFHLWKLILVLFLVRFCCGMQNTVVCTQIAAARSLWTAPGQAFLLRKEKKLSLFSHSLYSELSQPLLVASK